MFYTFSDAMCRTWSHIVFHHSVVFLKKKTNTYLMQSDPINKCISMSEVKRLSQSITKNSNLKKVNMFLSHLLIAGCDKGVQTSVRPFVRPSVRQHLRRSLVFSTSEIAASLKPCIVIVPDIPFKHAP